MKKVDQDYLRSKWVVSELLTRLRLPVHDIWNPNTERDQSGADVGVTLADGSRIGVQVTEIDPFSEPGTRGRERKQAKASAWGVYGNYAQNDPAVILSAIRRAVETKTRVRPTKSQFDVFWLLMCTGVPDAPTSTFIPTSPLAVANLDSATTQLLRNSCYAECFLLPLFGTERAIYRWSRSGAGRWQKRVFLEEAPWGTRDAEYMRELLRTRGKDENVVAARVREILDEMRESTAQDQILATPRDRTSV